MDYRQRDLEAAQAAPIQRSRRRLGGAMGRRRSSTPGSRTPTGRRHGHRRAWQPGALSRCEIAVQRGYGEPDLRRDPQGRGRGAPCSSRTRCWTASRPALQRRRAGQCTRSRFDVLLADGAYRRLTGRVASGRAANRGLAGGRIRAARTGRGAHGRLRRPAARVAAVAWDHARAGRSRRCRKPCGWHDIPYSSRFRQTLNSRPSVRLQPVLDGGNARRVASLRTGAAPRCRRSRPRPRSSRRVARGRRTRRSAAEVVS